MFRAEEDLELVLNLVHLMLGKPPVLAVGLLVGALVGLDVGASVVGAVGADVGASVGQNSSAFE